MCLPSDTNTFTNERYMFEYWNPPSWTKCSNQLSTLDRFNFLFSKRKFGELQRVSQVALMVKDGLLMQGT